MNRNRPDYEAILPFSQVPVGTVLKGAGKFLKSYSHKNGSVYNQLNGYAWCKDDSETAKLVINGAQGKWVEVTPVMMEAAEPDIAFFREGEIITPEESIRRRANRRSNWEYPMGRRPDLLVEFSPRKLVCVIKFPVL